MSAPVSSCSLFSGKIPMVEAFISAALVECGKKATVWWYNVKWFTSIAAQYNNSHYHHKWNAEIIDGRVVFQLAWRLRTPFCCASVRQQLQNSRH